MIQLKGGLPNFGVEGFLRKAFKGCNVYEFFGKPHLEYAR